MNCINAANQVYGSDDLCTEGFVKIIEATSVPSVSAAAQDICLIQDCKNRLASFIYFLDACDGLDDNDVRIMTACYQGYYYLHALYNYF